MTDGLYYVCAVEYHMTACVFATQNRHGATAFRT